MNPSKTQRKIDINLEFPIIVVVGLIFWRYGGYAAATAVAWTMVVILAIAFALLSYVSSNKPHNAMIELGGLKVGSHIGGQPSRRTSATLLVGMVAFAYLSQHGHPLTLLGLVALGLELLPSTPSIWDEYLADVLRRATLQAGYLGMLAAVMAACIGLSSLEVAVLALSSYTICLQVYLMRWQQLNANPE
jgi:hypothetical protein